MKEKSLNDASHTEEFELAILEAQNEELRKQRDDIIMSNKIDEEYDKKTCEALSKRLGRPVINIKEMDDINLPLVTWGEIFDEVYGTPGDLIQPSHRFYKYSLIKKNPELQKHIPAKRTDSALQLLLARNTSRAFEIVNEYTSDNTRSAHMGDLVYWQAWLSAVGFTFHTPITEQEVLLFIVQHAEGLDTAIDEKLFQQGYKAKLGPHKLATIKRRVGSLSVFLAGVKWPNPCRQDEIRLVLQKLTKKYGSSKPAGKAITRDILDDMLDTCKDTLLDLRDKSLLLFAWGSGGRRRAEVASADIKDLTKNPAGEFVYNIPRSKTDQEGKGYDVPVKGRAAKALNDWLTASGISEGAIFRAVAKGGKLHGALSDIDVYRIVRRRLKKAGYDETQFGAHSLRSGFVTEAGRRQKPLGDVMAMTTHKNVGTVMKYYQAGNIINNSAANLAD